MRAARGGSSHRSFILLRKLAIFDNMEPACLEEVSSRLQALKAPAGEYIIRAGEFGDAMYFINAGAVQASSRPPPLRRAAALSTLRFVCPPRPRNSGPNTGKVPEPTVGLFVQTDSTAMSTCLQQGIGWGCVFGRTAGRLRSAPC